MAERFCSWCKGTGKLTGGRATYDCTICRDPNERKPMYDRQPKTPDPLKLAVALTGGSPTAEECHLAGQWIAEATRPKPASLTPEMLSEEDRETWLFAKQTLLNHRSRLDQLRKESERSGNRHAEAFYSYERDMAHKGVLLILRLLNSPNTGEG